MIRNVTVFGTSKAEEGDGVFELAYSLGRKLAEAEFTLVNGGYGGTMLAGAKGAHEAGGKVVGVTCRAFNRGKANAYVTEEHPTETLSERLATLIAMGDAYVALPGGTGTLLEVADVWEHKNKGFVGTDKPIVLLGEFWKPLLEMMRSQDERACACVKWSKDADEAVGVLKEMMR
jgi:uncharacterized protein (TIGR00730 family)